MKQYIPLFLVLVIVLLVACGQSTETLPAQSIEQPTATLDRGTAAAPEGVRIGITVIPSTTWTPTYTKSTKTPEPTWTPLPTNTPELTGMATPPGLAKLQPGEWEQVWYSPDRKWLWTYEHKEGSANQFVVTHFAKIDGTLDWKIQLNLEYFKKLNRLPMETQSYRPFFWLPNSPYVYLVGTGCCIDGPIYFYTGLNMARLNLNTGQLTTQVPGWHMHSFAFSENGKYFLDGNLWDGGLKIYRLSDSTLFDIPLPEKYPQSGDASFSPDNKRLAIITCVSDQSDCDRFSLLIVDIEEKVYQETIPDLLEAMGSKDFVRTKINWVSNNGLRLEEVPYNEKAIPREWSLDIVTGKLSELK